MADDRPLNLWEAPGQTLEPMAYCGDVATGDWVAFRWETTVPLEGWEEVTAAARRRRAIGL